MRDAIPPHVLLIDHSTEMLELFQRLLANEGYRVAVSRDPLPRRQILALAPEVIVHDVLASGGVEEGLQCLTLLRRDPDTAGMPVVLWTVAAKLVLDPAIVEHLDHLGVRVLIKPVRLEDLVTAVGEALAAEALIAQALTP